MFMDLPKNPTVYINDKEFKCKSVEITIDNGMDDRWLPNQTVTVDLDIPLFNKHLLDNYPEIVAKTIGLTETIDKKGPTMSKFAVKVRKIHHFQSHPNADNLCIAYVSFDEPVERTPWTPWLGTVVPKNRYNTTDPIVYVPTNAILPPGLAEQWGIKRWTKSMSGGRSRVKTVNIRGVKSNGIIIDLPLIIPISLEKEVVLHPPFYPKLGDDLTYRFSITEYIPKIIPPTKSKNKKQLIPMNKYSIGEKVLFSWNGQRKHGFITQISWFECDSIFGYRVSTTSPEHWYNILECDLSPIRK